MKKAYLPIAVLIMVIIAGCASKKESGVSEKSETESYSYRRTTLAIDLPDNVNPYRIVYSSNGLFCYEHNQTEDKENNVQDEVVFYYQEYSESESRHVCTVNQYVNSYYGDSQEDTEVSVFCNEEEPVIKEFTANGVKNEVPIPGLKDKVHGLSSLYKLKSGAYAISSDTELYIISDAGKNVEIISFEDTIDKLLTVGDTSYALVYAKEGMKKSLLKIDGDNHKTQKTFNLDDDLINIFSFDNRFALVYKDKIVLADTNGENREELLDLNKQVLFATQIEDIIGDKESFKVIINDLIDTKKILCVSMSSKLEEDTKPDPVPEIEQTKEMVSEQKKEKKKPNRNGEKVTVKMVVPADYYYNIEYHAKKFNQQSDYSFIDVIRLEESLEDYLGKGERPDIVMFNDNTEVPDYVNKNILADLSPYIEDYGYFDYEDITPAVREMISNIDKDKTYVLATNFSLLLMASDGTEKKADGTCNIIDYLEWYNQYLTDKDLNGTGAIESLLYSIVVDFYDENTCDTKFCQEDFKEIMSKYKAIIDEHPEKLDILGLGAIYDRPTRNILNAPAWYAKYENTQLAFKEYSFEGIPTMSGNSRVYTKLDYPMGVLEASSCKEEAYDFISYNISLDDYLLMSDPEDMNSADDFTNTMFSILQNNLDTYIYNTEKPYMNILWRSTMERETLYYTKDNLDNLKRLLANTTPITKAQDDIYGFLLEEMEAYFTGNKDLDDACEILDSRTKLYLMEKR